MKTNTDDAGLSAFGTELKPPYFTAAGWVSPFNFLPEVRAQWTVPQSVEIHDVTLRDGEQTARIVFTPQEKIEIATELDRLGVASIEPGLPATAEDREVISTLASMGLRAKVKPLVRVREDDVAHAIECRADAIVLEFGINPFLLKIVYGITPEELTARVIEFSNVAKSAGLEVEFMGWDTFRIPTLDYVRRFFEPIVDQGSIDRLTVSDTFGMAHPSAVAHMFGELTTWFPGLPLGLHVHNDFGLATATALVAVTSGASSVHTSVNALGERAGNVATEEATVALQYLLGIDAGINLSRLTRVSEIVAEVAKRPVAANKPIVGSHLFEVESGIVVHILEQMRASTLGETGISPFPPELVGREPYVIVPGRGTGRHAVQALLRELQIEATDEQMDEITDRVKQLALVLKNALPADVFAAIVREVLPRAGTGSAH
jgi:isopropylmalate/homocitrate/citramalate synthase